MEIKAAEDLQKKYVTAAQEGMEAFGTAMGALRWYVKVFPVAMEQIKAMGCQHCTHSKCVGCKNQSHWFWDGAIGDAR